MALGGNQGGGRVKGETVVTKKKKGNYEKLISN